MSVTNKNYSSAHNFINKVWTKIVQRLFSEYLTDGIRNTLAIVVPVSLLFYLHFPLMAVGIGVGTLLIGLTDLPGNRGDKFRSAITSIILFFVVSLITTVSLYVPLLAACCIVVFTFVFAMFGILGARLGLIGLMSTVLAIFILGLRPANPLLFTFYIFLGSIWYYLISLVQVWIWPYRYIHHAIFECLSGTAALLRIREKAYNPQVDLDDFEEQNILLHLKLNTRQELMRNLLLGDKLSMRGDNETGKRLLRVGQDTIDLYEQVAAIHHDYAQLRKVLSDVNALHLVRGMIAELADALDRCSTRFLNPKKSSLPILSVDFENSRSAFMSIVAGQHFSLLKNIQENLDNIVLLIRQLDAPGFNLRSQNNLERTVDYKDFLSEREFSWFNLKPQFSLGMPAFRFALRLSVLCLIAVTLNRWLPSTHYTYWLLLTIMIVNRPSFGLTHKRNGQRLRGTLLGLFTGIVLVYILPGAVPQLWIGVLALLGFFIFNRTQYTFSVVCVTVMVVLCLNVYRGDLLLIIGDRLIFTILGCVLSFAAAFLFPIWETPRLKKLISDTIFTNRNYLLRVMEAEDEKDIHQVRLARKEAYLQFAALAEAIQSFKKEPHSSKLHIKSLLHIQRICYQINGHIAALSLQSRMKEANLYNRDLNTVLEHLHFCMLNQGSLNFDNNIVDFFYNEEETTEQTLLIFSRELKQYF